MTPEIDREEQLKKNFEEILDEFSKNRITRDGAVQLLGIEFEDALQKFKKDSRLPQWLKPDDFEFALALHEENKLEGVKWLREKAKDHSSTPLRTAKELLDKHSKILKNNKNGKQSLYNR